MRIAEDPIAVLRTVLTEPGAEKLLDDARAVSLGAPLLGARRELLELLERVGGVAARDGAVQLTHLGRLFMDAAREHRNWIDDGREFPVPLLPEVEGRTVLDVGCGSGRYVLTLHRQGAFALGIDREEAKLQLGRVFAELEGEAPPRLILGIASRIPLPSESADLAICIRALNYMDQKRSLGEVARVLKRDGELVLAYSTFADFLRRLRASWRRLASPRWAFGSAVVLLNSFSMSLLRFRIVGGEPSIPHQREAHPTQRSMMRLLRSVGLEPVAIRSDLQPNVRWALCRRLDRRAPAAGGPAG